MSDETYIIMCACGNAMRVKPNDGRVRCDLCIQEDKDRKKKVKREPRRN